MPLRSYIMRMMNPSGRTGPGDCGATIPPRGIAPRVRLPGCEAALPLEKHIRGMLRAGAVGRVNLYGPLGSGKSFAIDWTKASLGTNAAVDWIDINKDPEIPAASDRLT